MSTTLFHFSPEGKFFRELDQIEKYPNIPTKVVLFLLDARYDVIELIKAHMHTTIITKFTKKLDDMDKLLFECELLDDEEKERAEKVYFLVSKKHHVALLISNQSGKRFKTTINFFYKFYPLVSRIFLRSYQMLSILCDVEKEEKVQLITKSYVAKRYFGRKKSEVAYEYITYQQAFQQATEHNLWIDSILLDISKDERRKGSVRLSRKGIFSYSYLNFSEFYSFLVEPIIENLIQVYKSFLLDRSRTITSPEAKPLAIKLNEDIFKKDSAIKLFIKQIQKGLKRWGFSVFNQEENFVHVFLHDYDSGSSYDLFVSSYDEITIIPQTQVVPLSINKLIAFLLDNYEGELRNV